MNVADTKLLQTPSGKGFFPLYYICLLAMLGTISHMYYMYSGKRLDPKKNKIDIGRSEFGLNLLFL